MPVANTLCRGIIPLCQIKYRGSLWRVFQCIVSHSLPDRALSVQEINVWAVWLPISAQKGLFLWKKLFCFPGKHEEGFVFLFFLFYFYFPRLFQRGKFLVLWKQRDSLRFSGCLASFSFPFWSSGSPTAPPDN